MTMPISDRSGVPTAAGGLGAAWSVIVGPLQSTAALALRVALAVPFFRSGLTKWDGFLSLSPSAVYLFENEFKLHLFGAAVPLPFPDTMALLSGVGEIVLPILLVLGLATRFAALGIIGMTAVIFLTYPSHWPTESLPWAAMALALVAFGPGRIALDRLVSGAFGRATA